MTDRFKLEEKIQQCWNVIDDLKIVSENISEGQEFRNLDPVHSDKIQNLLLGMESLYSLKFHKLWDTFEDCIENNWFNSTPQSTKMPRITRLEVIDQSGRSYTNNKSQGVDLSVQDQGRTLKLFTQGDQDRGNTDTR